MKLLVRCLVFLILAINLDAMELRIVAVAGSGLHIMLLNDEGQSIMVSKRFAYGTLSGNAEILLAITDKSGIAHVYSSKARIGPAPDGDRCWLSPGQFVGKVIAFKRIAKDYDLLPGDYEVVASYRNTISSESIRASPLVSNRAAFIVASDLLEDGN